MSAVRLHPFHFLKYIKYGLILCVIPILRAMLAFDIAAAWLAFTQDLLILLACGGILATLWQASCAGLADGVLTVRQGVLLRRPALYRACMAVSYTHLTVQIPMNKASSFGLTALRSMIRDGRLRVVTAIIKARIVPSWAPL